MSVKIINDLLLSQVSDQACKSGRKRMNYNFHPQPEDHAQRMLNAIEPDSYICPHRHINPIQDEAFIVLKGSGGVITFSDDGDVDEIYLLDPLKGLFGVDIPGGVYHTILSLQKHSVYYEVKPGPYNPKAVKGFAPWAPGEDDPAGPSYLNEMRKRLIETYSL